MSLENGSHKKKRALIDASWWTHAQCTEAIPLGRPVWLLFVRIIRPVISSGRESASAFGVRRAPGSTFKIHRVDRAHEIHG